MISLYIGKFVWVVSVDVSVVPNLHDLSVHTEVCVCSHLRRVCRAQGLRSLCIHGSLCG